MAFCNSCGATLTPGTQFCNKCGAAASNAPAASPVPTPSAPPPPKGGSSALKIVLIVVAVIVVIGILGVATVGFIGYRIAKSAHVRHNGDDVKVETPFGSVESSKDPEKAAHDLGVDIYPGAEVQKSGAATASFGGIHTVSAAFQSNDSVEKVCSFYKEKFPGAMSTTSDQNHCTIVSNDSKAMITINIEPNADGSKIQISNVTKKTASE
jgi:hypothetical protein